MIHGPVDGRAYATLIKEIQRPFVSLSPPDTVWPIYYAGDTAFFNSRNGYSIGFQSDIMPISSVLGIPDLKSERRYENRFLTARPRNFPYSADGDWINYGSLLGLPGFTTRHEESDAWLHEKPVSHDSYAGVLGSSELVSKYGYYPVGSVVDQFGFGFEARRLLLGNPNGARATDFNDQGFLVFTEYSNESYSREEYNRDAWEMATHVVQYLSQATREIWFGYYRCSYLDVVNLSSRDVNEWHFDISYKYRMEYAPHIFGDVYHAVYEVHILFDCGFRPIYGGADPFASNLVHQDVFWHDDRSTVTCIDFAGINGSYPDPNPQFGLHVMERTTLGTNIYQVDGTQFESDFDSFLHWRPGGSLAQSLSRDVDALMRHLRPSSFIAASQALDTYTSVLATNWLQVFQHLKDILGLLPDLAGLAELAASAANGDPGALLKFIDILTEEILKMKFERLPLIRAVDELNRANVQQGLTDLLQPTTRTIYGSFNYVFPQNENWIGDGTLILTTRGKIRVHLDLTTALAGYLVGNSVGVIPNFSRTWSLLPFSFVVDWFTNMGKRLHLVDNQLLYMTLGIRWCLWSYKVVYFPSESKLEEFNLSNLPYQDQFSTIAYRREWSRCMPKLSESKFDFMSPSHSPDPLVLGSLIWQLL